MMIYVHICMRTFTLSSENIRHIMHYVWVINNCLFLLIKKYHCILFSYIFTVICNDLLQIIRQLFDNSWKKFRGFRCDKVFDEFLNMVFVRESFLHKSNRRIVYCKISLFRRVKWIQFFFPPFLLLHAICCCHGKQYFLFKPQWTMPLSCKHSCMLVYSKSLEWHIRHYNTFPETDLFITQSNIFTVNCDIQTDLAYKSTLRFLAENSG